MMEAGRREEVTSHAARRLSGQDAIFVYSETAAMPMHTIGTVLLDPSRVTGGFGFEEIEKALVARIHRMPPFRQRLLEVPLGLGHPVLVDDPGFRLENHLHRAALPAPGGLRELAHLVGELAGRPLDRHQPLWEMWAVEGLEGGRLALVTKLHHCMMDGASGSSQMGALMDLDPDASPPPPSGEWSPPPLPSPLGLAASSVGSRFVSPLRLARLVSGTTRGMLARRRAEREVARAGHERPGILETAPETPFNRAISPHRSVAYGSAPLAEVKRVKNAFAVTVNDAVLAACALALRRWLLARDALPEKPLLCMVPVSLKAAAEKQEFSNKVSGMTIRLPTQLEDPEAVVRAVHRETADAKRVFQAVEDDLVPAWLQLVPPMLATWGTRLYSELHLADRMPPIVNLVVSNMMGPPVPLYYGGARVEAVYPMGPVSEGVGLNITLLSNMGRLDVGVLACRELVPDPWEISEGITRALAVLSAAAGLRDPT